MSDRQASDQGGNKLKKHSRYLGRYELIGQLARGGMGTVYLARHAGEAGFQRLFAVKVLHAHLADEPGFVDMLRDEGRLAARIHHPNVVGVVDLGAHGDHHYIVMDYVEGPTLSTLIRRSEGKELPLGQCIAIVIDALEGLHAAHTLKDDEGNEIRLVHRDVSPQNILVGIDGLGRITDFGIAKAESRIASTQPGTRKGKLPYMSPEQFTGSHEIDRRTDIWAIGVVLWNVLTGENLFHGHTQPATIHNVMTREVRPPSEVSPRCPEALDPIVLKALQRDPADRHETALEVAEALRSVAARTGLLGSRHGVAEWVKEVFATDLEQRRAAIRSTAGNHTFVDDSRVTSLPSLPTVGGITPSGISGETSLHDGETASLTTATPVEDSSSDASATASPLKRVLVISGAIATLGAAGVLVFRLGAAGNALPTETQQPEPGPSAQIRAQEDEASPPATPAPEPPPNAASADETKADESDDEAAETAAEGESTAADAPSAESPQEPVPKPRAPRRKWYRPSRAAPSPKRQPTGAQSPTKPSPSPIELERNPYLRR